MTNYPIHHENITARTASEDGGSGHFDVIQWGDRTFKVHDGDGGLVLDEHTNLRSSVASAKRHARAYDEEG